MSHGAFPHNQGLYDPINEHDACGVGFVAHIGANKAMPLFARACSVLENLTHRGAVGADPLAGDGAGILIQIPDVFLREECAGQGMELPGPGNYAVGMIFLPQDDQTRAECEALIERTAEEEGQILLGWRDVPTDNSGLG